MASPVNSGPVRSPRNAKSGRIPGEVPSFFISSSFFYAGVENSSNGRLSNSISSRKGALVAYCIE